MHKRKTASKINHSGGATANKKFIPNMCLTKLQPCQKIKKPHCLRAHYITMFGLNVKLRAVANFKTCNVMIFEAIFELFNLLQINYF